MDREECIKESMAHIEKLAEMYSIQLPETFKEVIKDQLITSWKYGNMEGWDKCLELLFHNKSKTSLKRRGLEGCSEWGSM